MTSQDEADAGSNEFVLEYGPSHTAEGAHALAVVPTCLVILPQRAPSTWIVGDSVQLTIQAAPNSPPLLNAQAFCAINGPDGGAVAANNVCLGHGPTAKIWNQNPRGLAENWCWLKPGIYSLTVLLAGVCTNGVFGFTRVTYQFNVAPLDSPTLGRGHHSIATGGPSRGSESAQSRPIRPTGLFSIS